MAESVHPTDPADMPTVRAPHAGARVCGALWCSSVALEGTERCARHSGLRLRILTPAALLAVAAQMDDEGSEG